MRVIKHKALSKQPKMTWFRKKKPHARRNDTWGKSVFTLTYLEQVMENYTWLIDLPTNEELKTPLTVTG